MSLAISSAFNKLAVEAGAVVAAAVCARSEAGEVANTADSSNRTLGKRFPVELKVAARNVVGNNNPPHQTALAAGSGTTECTIGAGLLALSLPCECQGRTKRFLPKQLHDTENPQLRRRSLHAAVCSGSASQNGEGNRMTEELSRPQAIEKMQVGEHQEVAF
jgi:hypothetical protein